MSLFNKINAFCQNKSLSFKSTMGLALLLVLIAFVAITGYLSLRYVRMANDAIGISNEIQRLILEVDGGMAKARHLHGKFFLYYPQIGLKAAHETYAQPAIRQISHVVSSSKSLKEMIACPEVSDTIRKSRIDVNLYLSSAKRFADTSIDSFELVTRLATPEKGLYARLDFVLRELQKAFMKLPGMYHEMVSFVQQYQVSHERFLMQSAFNVEFKLRQLVASSPLFTRPRQEEINILLDRFKDIAESIMEVDVAIHARFNDFVIQEQMADTISENLVKLAKNEVQKSRKIIARTHGLTNLILVLVTVIGLVAAGIIARLITIKIIHRILQLTKTAEALKNGHFDVVANEGGKDEIGELSRTFNFMAVRIRELVEDLEKKVAQRTVDLAVSEKRFHGLFEHSSSGIAIYEAIDGGDNFRLKEINPAMEKIQAVKRDHVLGEKLTCIFPSMIEDGLLDVFKTAWQTDMTSIHSVNWCCDDQVHFWHEYEVYKLPGGDLVAVCNDKSFEKQAENQKKAMADKLQQARKMEAIGLLAGGVAHDLNNIMAPVVGYPELLLPDLPEQSEFKEALMAIHESGQRAVAIVADLLTVAGGVANAKKELNLNDIINTQLGMPEVHELLLCHEDIQCRTHLDPQLLKTFCSPVHIEKCIMNLLVNAIDAMDGKGEVVLSTANCMINGTSSLINLLPVGNYVVFLVSDTGDEVSEKDLQHIFEPFYVKKIMGRSGTGLGLAVTWNIMKEHDGIIQVESGPEGTCFSLYFPAMEKTAGHAIETSAGGADDLMGHGEIILVVDDDAQVSLLAENILKRFGYHAVCVNSGEAALEYVRQNPVDLVLLDMLMDPGINGCQTYEAMLEIKPGQKAVVASGFSQSDDIEKTLEMGAGGFIKKPYAINELARIIKDCLR